MSNSPQSERRRVRSEWDELEKLVDGENIPINTFLRHMWISRTGEESSFKLYDVISPYLDETVNPHANLLRIVFKCIAYIYHKKDCIEIHHESRNVIRAIHVTLGIKQALPLLLVAYRRFDCIEIHHESRNVIRAIHVTLGIKQALPLLLVAYRRFEKTTEFSKLALAIETLVIRHKYLAFHDTSELVTAFFKAIKQVK